VLRPESLSSLPSWVASWTTTRLKQVLDLCIFIRFFAEIIHDGFHYPRYFNLFLKELATPDENRRTAVGFLIFFIQKTLF